MTSPTRTGCARCGVERVTKKGRGLLCRDCVTVLSFEERQRWAA